MTLTFSYERKSNNETARNNTPDLLTELTTSPMSDNPIVLEQQEFKIAPSWRKFARLGSIGTVSKLNITTCLGGAAVERVALAGDILYLQGRYLISTHTHLIHTHNFQSFYSYLHCLQTFILKICVNCFETNCMGSKCSIKVEVIIYLF